MSVFRRDEFVRSVQGQSVPGAEVFLCTQPANATSYPPTPLASIFSDPAGTIPIIQPVITDGFGHCSFYVVAGTYTVVVANNNVIQQIYPDQLIGSNGVGSVSFETNGIANTDQALLNLKNGTEITVTSDGIGGVVIDTNVPIPAAVELQTNGSDNTLQTKLNLHSSDATIILTPDGSGGVDLKGTGSSPSTPFSTESANVSTQNTDQAGANLIYLYILPLPRAVSFTKLALDCTSGDNTVTISDVGIYAENGGLLANIGAQTGITTGLVEQTIVQGSATLAAGNYIFAVTANANSGGWAFQTGEAQYIGYTYTTITSSTGGGLPASIVVVKSALSHFDGSGAAQFPIIGLIP